jgi:hypothetical protein
MKALKGFWREVVSGVVSVFFLNLKFWLCIILVRQSTEGGKNEGMIIIFT